MKPREDYDKPLNGGTDEKTILQAILEVLLDLRDKK